MSDDNIHELDCIGKSIRKFKEKYSLFWDLREELIDLRDEINQDIWHTNLFEKKTKTKILKEINNYEI